MIARESRRDAGDGGVTVDKSFGVLGDGGDDDVAVGLDAVRVVVTINLKDRIVRDDPGRRELLHAPATRLLVPSAKEESAQERPRVAATSPYTIQSHA